MLRNIKSKPYLLLKCIPLLKNAKILFDIQLESQLIVLVYLKCHDTKCAKIKLCKTISPVFKPAIYSRASIEVSRIQCGALSMKNVSIVFFRMLMLYYPDRRLSYFAEIWSTMFAICWPCFFLSSTR